MTATALEKGRKKTNLTTLCYIEQDGKYLMMHRVKKAHDINHDKWIGVGGHFEPDETPEECLLREVREETGLILDSFRLRGIITFMFSLKLRYVGDALVEKALDGKAF